jgi:hypothetical protein
MENIVSEVFSISQEILYCVNVNFTEVPGMHALKWKAFPASFLKYLPGFKAQACHIGTNWCIPYQALCKHTYTHTHIHNFTFIYETSKLPIKNDGKIESSKHT